MMMKLLMNPRTLLSSRSIVYSILSLLEQQEQTLQRLAITAALRRLVAILEKMKLFLIQNLVNHLDSVEEPYIESVTITS